MLAEGTPESPIENLLFRDLSMRMSGYEEIRKVRKMRGGSKTVAAGMPDYGPTPAAMIFAHIQGLRLDGIRTIWPENANPPERAAVFGDRLRDVLISGFHGRGSTPGAQSIQIQNSSEVHQGND